MKSRYLLLLPVLLLLPFGLLAADGRNTLRVRALIDGRSQLVVRSDSIGWQHFDWARPGQLRDQNEPTYLNRFVWFPKWPESAERLPGPSFPLSALTSFTTNRVTIQVIAGRGSVQILQQPDPTNQNTLIVEFDDNATAGDDWYEIELSGVSTTVLPQLAIEIGCVALKWDTESDRLYQPQYTTNLLSGVWVDLGAPVQGTSSNILVMDFTSQTQRRFYRVIPLP